MVREDFWFFVMLTVTSIIGVISIAALTAPHLP
jgi:hypothetical protein